MNEDFKPGWFDLVIRKISSRGEGLAVIELGVGQGSLSVLGPIVLDKWISADSALGLRVGDELKGFLRPGSNMVGTLMREDQVLS